MASTAEVKAKEAAKKIIKEVCTRRGLVYEIDWNAGSAFMRTLDATGVIAGHPFIAEVKRMDEEEVLTAQQTIKKRKFEKAGAFVFDLTDPTSLEYLRFWLETLEPREAHAP